MATISAFFRSQISKMNLFVIRVNGFRQKAVSQMFGKAANTPLIMATHTET